MSFMDFAGRVVEFVTGDNQKPEKKRGTYRTENLSEHLPYRVFDKVNELFLLEDDSEGFVLEVSPLIGADERVSDILTAMISDILVSGTVFSVTNWSSPRISEMVEGWQLPRFRKGGVFRQLARFRAEMLRAGAWQTLASDGPFLLKNFRVVLSVGAPKGSPVTRADLITMRQSIVAALSSINVECMTVGPTELIQFIDDITCPSTGAGDDAAEYSPFDDLHRQCVRRDLVTIVRNDRLLLNAQSLRPTGEVVDGVPELANFRPTHFDVRSMAVRQFPQSWAPWDAQKIIGDILNPKLQLPCPTLTTVTGIVGDSEAALAKAGYKFTRTTSLADTKSAKLLPNLKHQAREWEDVSAKLKEGQKLIQTFYSVTILSPRGDGDRNQRMLKSLYKAAGWDMIDQTCLQLPAFLGNFPLIMVGGLAADFKRNGVFKNLLSINTAAMLPLQGEYCGGTIPHLLFVGRRGVPQYWSPFQNSAGNHNVAVAGKSGSGKSVLLQDLTASLAGAGAKVIVIDDGRSFQHMAQAIGGTFTEFKLSSGISINPFRMIDAHLAASDEDYLVDCMSMLKSIISQMARFETRLDDTERGLIDKALNDVWLAYGRDGTIDAIIERLESDGHPQAADLATAMLAFGSGGTFGKFFIGDANLDLTSDLTVFELSDLASREELRAVVLTSIMFVASQTMRKIDRTIPKALIIDEAWQMLKGGAMAEFVEVYARTCRKYGASLITATQSFNDYYKSEGSRSAYENSDWTLTLEQKPDSINEFKKLGRLEISPFTERLLRSLKRNGTDYSDILIRGPDTEAVCRLVLDPFSATLYSSSPQVFGKIEALVHDEGYAMADAIEAVAFNAPARAQVAA